MQGQCPPGRQGSGRAGQTEAAASRRGLGNGRHTIRAVHATQRSNDAGAGARRGGDAFRLVGGEDEDLAALEREGHWALLADHLDLLSGQVVAEDALGAHEDRLLILTADIGRVIGGNVEEA